MNTILLSSKTEEEKTNNYYITSITKEEKEKIEANHEKQTFESSIYYNAENIEVIGEPDTTKSHKTISSNVLKYIDFFITNTAGEKQKHYRDYSQSEERQKKNSWLINICPDHRSSWGILMTILKDPKYIIIWFDSKDKKYDNIRKFIPLSKDYSR